MATTRLGLTCLIALRLAESLFGGDTLNTHAVKLDANGQLLSWVQPVHGELTKSCGDWSLV
jgi:hypothetical protein